MHHPHRLLAVAQRVSDKLHTMGCTVTRISVDGAMPLIEIDRPPTGGPAMVLAIRSHGGTPRTVWVADWQGCRIEAPARRPVARRFATETVYA
jgi:hypothetical protein